MQLFFIVDLFFHVENFDTNPNQQSQSVTRQMKKKNNQEVATFSNIFCGGSSLDEAGIGIVYEVQRLY